MTSCKPSKVFVTRKIEQLANIQTNFQNMEVTFNKSEVNMNRDSLYNAASRSDALITMLCDRIDKDFLEQNSHLKVISNYAVGLNNIDLHTAHALEIKVGHTPNVLTHSTAETAVMLLLNLSRNFNQAQKFIKEAQWKTWEPMLHNGDDLRQKKIGIIGFGRIGQDFAEKAFNLWGCEILVLARESYKNLRLPFPFKIVEKKELQKTAEVISVHCPLTKDTEQLINSKFIKEMNKPFYFINTARGQIHNEDDLIHGLDSGKIKGVGLDVTNPEPMLIKNKLLASPQAIILPHIGSATSRTRAEMTRMCFENIQAGLNNEKLPFDAFL